MRRSCDRIDTQGGEYDGEGRSKFYGFGHLNAEKAVTLARPVPRNSMIISRDFALPLPNLQTVTAILEVTESHSIENLAVEVDIQHPYIGDLVLKLIPPATTSSRKITLHDRAGDANRSVKKIFDALTTPELSVISKKTAKGI